MSLADRLLLLLRFPCNDLQIHHSISIFAVKLLAMEKKEKRVLQVELDEEELDNVTGGARRSDEVEPKEHVFPGSVYIGFR